MSESQLKLGEEARDLGLSRVEQGAGSEWWKKAMKCIKAVCLQRHTFTTDLVWMVFEQAELEPPREPKVMGALMMRAKKLRWCVPTERMVNTKRKSAHARRISVWKSKLYPNL